MDCSEKALSDNQSIIFSAKSDSGIKSICFDNKGQFDGGAICDIGIDNLIFHMSPTAHCNYVHRDWQNTVGESFGSIVAEVSRHGNTYSMKYRYYFIDIYEWALHYGETFPPSIVSSLHIFHEAGTAQEYLMNGSFEGVLTWKIGNTAYHPNVASQIENTLKELQGSESWELSNEYERFYKKINGHYDKKYILGGEYK